MRSGFEWKMRDFPGSGSVFDDEIKSDIRQWVRVLPQITTMPKNGSITKRADYDHPSAESASRWYGVWGIGEKT